MAQLNLKKVIARLLQWVQYPLVKNNVDGTNTFYQALRTDTGTSVSMGIGSGGVNHGVYSGTLGKWLIYGDASTVYVNGVQMRKTAVTVTKSGSAWTAGSIQAWYNSGTVTIQFGNVSIGTISARTTIATIPALYRPPTEMYAKATSAGFTPSIIVNASGEIRVDPGFSGKTGIYASLTYAQWG